MMTTYSVVIPCHNEASHIGKLLRAAEHAFADVPHEFIVVADGCTDGSEEAVLGVARDVPAVRIVRNATRVGKGGAIRRGVEASRGELVGFIDGDGEIDPVYIRNAFSALEKEKVDVVVGTRHGPNAAYHTTPLRLFTSWAYQTVIWILFGFRLTDTQCGLKVFTAESAKRLFASSDVNGYAFDVDVLLHAFWTGYAIREIPIVQRFKGTSSVHLRHVVEMVRDTCRTYDRHVREILARHGEHRAAKTQHLVRSFLFLPFTSILAFALQIVVPRRK